MRYDGETGSFLGAFVPAGRGGLNSPRQLNFGPDGDLYVASAGNDRILRYDGSTGAFEQNVTIGGGLDGPTSFTFGKDELLYVCSVITNQVKRYDPRTGLYLGNFVTENLQVPHDVGIGPDGRFYVVNANGIRIRIYNPINGNFRGNYVRDGALSGALGMAWDGLGSFYVANQAGNEVRRYDSRTGAFIEQFVRPGAGGLQSPLFLTFFPTRNGVGLFPSAPAQAGEVMSLVATGLRPGERVAFVHGSVEGLAAVPSCPGKTIGIFDARLIAFRLADESGRAVLHVTAPSGLAGATVFLQVLGERNCTSSFVLPLEFVAGGAR